MKSQKRRRHGRQDCGQGRRSSLSGLGGTAALWVDRPSDTLGHTVQRGA